MGIMASLLLLSMPAVGTHLGAKCQNWRAKNKINTALYFLDVSERLDDEASVLPVIVGTVKRFLRKTLEDKQRTLDEIPTTEAGVAALVRKYIRQYATYPCSNPLCLEKGIIKREIRTRCRDCHGTGMNNDGSKDFSRNYGKLEEYIFEKTIRIPCRYCDPDATNAKALALVNEKLACCCGGSRVIQASPYQAFRRYFLLARHGKTLFTMMREVQDLIPGIAKSEDGVKEQMLRILLKAGDEARILSAAFKVCAKFAEYLFTQGVKAVKRPLNWIRGSSKKKKNTKKKNSQSNPIKSVEELRQFARKVVIPKLVSWTGGQEDTDAVAHIFDKMLRIVLKYGLEILP